MSIIATLGLLTATAHAASVEVVNPQDPDSVSVYPDFASALAGSPDGATLTLTTGDHGDLAIDSGRNVVVRAGENVIVRSLRVTGSTTRVEAHGLFIPDAAQAITVDAATLMLSDSTVAGAGDDTDGYAIAARNGARVGLQRVEVTDSRGVDGVVIVDEGAAMAIVESTLRDNRAVNGGAIYAVGATLGLRDVQFRGNTAQEAGGAMALYATTANLVDCTFTRGEATLGAGVYAGPEAILTGTSVTLVDNVANQGGQIYAQAAQVSLTRATLQAGRAMDGAGVYATNSDVQLTNALFSGQVAPGAGGALYQDGGEVRLRYATITDNTAAIGAGLASEGGRAELTALIVAGNDGEAIANAGGLVELDHSLVEGAESGAGLVGAVTTGLDLIDADPGFTDAQDGDYTLTLQSPALDAGAGGEADLDGTAADWGMYGGGDAWLVEDQDGDGYVHGRDCDDTDPEVNEHAPDRWYDGIDANCDLADDYDQDGDGWKAALLGGGDCDDVDASVNPGMAEAAGDKTDANCDGLADPDLDGDGWPSSVDCDDSDASVNPTAPEDYYDGRDSDCSGNSDFDQDGDGYEAAAYGGTDCDDDDAFVNPAAPEIDADGVDQDCDGMDAQATRNGSDAEVDPADTASAAGPAEGSTGSATGCSTLGAGHAGLMGILLALGALVRRKED